MRSSALAAGVRSLRDRLAAQRDRHESDEQLLHAFTARREEGAFAVLVHRHGPMVMGVCRRVLGHQQDAEDAFQATFLVLARNAAALRNKTALASWLQGTAYRTALKAKQSAARRRKHEGHAPPRSPADPAGELLWREVRTLLDEEIARLPEIYRSAFVLCCLESVSQAEAAQRLGVKEGTVSSRLTEARKRLSQRLARRGVELTALLAASALTTETASALPAGLLSNAIEGAVSPAVAALADSIPSLFGVGKVKLAFTLMLVASVLSGAGVWAFHSPPSPSAHPAEPPVAKTNDKLKTAPTKPEAAKTVEVQGRVLGPDGKPKAGAKLLLLGEDKIADLGVSAADGRFTVAVPKQTKGYLIARPSDAGMDFIALRQLQPGKPVELRLVNDQVIHGRIVNTEGKPVAGVRVGIRAIIDNTDDALDHFLTGRKQGRRSGRFFGVRHLWSAAAMLHVATTDADGRFALHGIGADRLVYLLLSGSGIAEEEIWIVNRAGFDPKPYNQSQDNPNVPKRARRESRELGTLFGPDVSVVAEAEKPIRGVVKDADTGKGRPNVVVYLSSPRNAPIAVPPQATTDAEGRYQLHGSRKAKSYTLEVVSDAKAGYMASQLHVTDTAGYQPLRADIRVKKGVIVTGKVIDRATDKSVPGTAWAAVLRDNPFAKEYPKFNSSELGRGNANRVETADNGIFRTVTIPGPVLLMGGLDYTRSTGKFGEGMKYNPPVVDAKYPLYFEKSRNHVGYYVFGGGRSPVQGHFCKVLEIKPGTAVVHQDILLERASALEVKIQDTEGHPVSDTWASGIDSENIYPAIRIEEASCSAYGLEARKPRLLVFYQPDKKLAGMLTLKGNEKTPVIVKLGSAGAIKGRLLDADGQPLAGVVVDVSYRESEANNVHAVIHATKQFVTDANGAFTLDELIPELKFQLSVRRGQQRFERQTKPAEATIQVQAGECRDLGAIKLKQLPDKEGE